MESATVQPHSTSRARLHEIDGLRALAIVLVILHHTVTGPVHDVLEAHGRPMTAALIGHLTNSGVELFFVLSGVVLLRPYFRGARRMEAGTYFRRRFVRLWPPYVAAWLLGGAVILMVTRVPTWYSPVLPSFDAGDWLRQAGIVNLGWPIYNLAWWSLTPEIYFYLLVPLIVTTKRTWVSRRRSGVVLWGVLIAASIALWHPVYSFPTVHPGSRTLLQFVAYLPCFFAGVLLARGDYSRRVGAALTASGVAWLIASQLVPRLNVHAAFALFYMGLVVLTTSHGVLQRFFARPLMVWLGERSYSLFLTHFSVLYATCHVGSLLFPTRTIGYFLFTRGTGYPAMLLVAMLLFSIVERRFARGLVTADAFWPWSPRRRGAPDTAARAHAA